MSEIVQGERKVLAEIARLVGEAHPPESWPTLTRGAELEKSLAKLLDSHHDKSADELAELASELNIGGAHTGGYLIDLPNKVGGEGLRAGLRGRSGAGAAGLRP